MVFSLWFFSFSFCYFLFLIYHFINFFCILLFFDTCTYFNDNVSWWHSVYGFDMECMRDSVLREAQVDVVHEEYIATSTANLKVYTLTTLTTSLSLEFNPTHDIVSRLSTLATQRKRSKSSIHPSPCKWTVHVTSMHSWDISIHILNGAGQLTATRCSSPLAPTPHPPTGSRPSFYSKSRSPIWQLVTSSRVRCHADATPSTSGPLRYG